MHCGVATQRPACGIDFGGGSAGGRDHVMWRRRGGAAWPPLLLVLLVLLLGPVEQRWIRGAAAGGLADLVSKYIGGDDGSGGSQEIAAQVAARNCAVESAAAECQPRTVLALQNGGPDTHPPVPGKPTHNPASSDLRPEELRYHTGSEATLTWSTASTEASIAVQLLAALGPQIEASLAAEAWGPITSPTQQWRVYRADGERVHSWADVATAPTLRSITEQYGVHESASAGAGTPTLADAPATSADESSSSDVNVSAAATAPPAAVLAAWDVPALYVVPEGRLFMWSTYQIGQVVPVKGCTHGRAPVRLRWSLVSRHNRIVTPGFLCDRRTLLSHLKPSTPRRGCFGLEIFYRQQRRRTSLRKHCRFLMICTSFSALAPVSDRLPKPLPTS
jgi:hypothetical protein